MAKQLDTCWRCGQPVYDNEQCAYSPTDGRYSHLNCPAMGQSVTYVVGTSGYAKSGQLVDFDTLQRRIEAVEKHWEQIRGALLALILWEETERAGDHCLLCKQVMIDNDGHLANCPIAQARRLLGGE